MTVKEMALKYYPQLWNIERLKFLVKSTTVQFTVEEYKEITGEDYQS